MSSSSPLARRLRPGLGKLRDPAGRAANTRSTPPTTGTGTRAVRLYIDDCLQRRGRPARSAISTCAGARRWSPHIYRILMRGGVFLDPADDRQGLRAGPAAASSTRPTRSRCSSSRRAGGRPTRSTTSSTSCPRRCDQRTPLVFGSRERGRPHRALPHRSEHDRRARAAVRQSRPVPDLRRTDVRQASHHLDHRLVGRRHDVGEAHLRHDLPAREDRGRLHRGRRLPRLRPRGDEEEDRRRHRAGHGTSRISTRTPTCSRSWKRCSSEYGRHGQRRDAPLCPRRPRRPRSTASQPGTFTDVEALRARLGPAVLRGAARLR